MINKEFVPYEQALELKELGFNEGCLGYYSKNKYTVLPDGPVLRFDERTADWDFEITTPAPLYQQAFRWFRSQGFQIDFSSHDGNTHDFYIKWAPGRSILSKIFSTYEEAELECLLSLIKTLKNKIK